MINTKLKSEFEAHIAPKLIADATSDDLWDYAKEKCFDNAKLKVHLETNAPWVGLIVTHVHLDHVLQEFLSAFCARPDLLFGVDRRKSLLDKLDFCRSVGLVSDEIADVLVRINSLRNKMAHQLVFEVKPATIKEFVDHFRFKTKKKFEVTRTFSIKNTDEEGFRAALHAAVIFLEEERIGFLIHQLVEIQGQEKLRIEMVKAQESLERYNTKWSNS